MRLVLFLERSVFWQRMLIVMLILCVTSPGCRDVQDRSDQVTQARFAFEFYYRKDQTVPHSVEKKIDFKVDILRGNIPEIAVDFESQKADLGEFEVVITPANNAFYLDVFEKGKSRRQVLRQLFQISSKVNNPFHGGHGFTGLQYVYHSQTDAELQYFGKAN